MPFHSLYYVHRQRKVPSLDTPKLRELQTVKLRAIIKHAYENVAYYRKLFDSAGVKPADVVDLTDLTKIPLTTKSDLQNLALDEVTAANMSIDKCKEMVISGPSGQPLRIFFTPKDYGFLEMLWARGFLENGLRLTDKRVSIEFQLPYTSWIQRLGIWRKDLLSVQYDPPSQVSIIKEMNPDALTGYPFDLQALAKAITAVDAKEIQPRLVFSLGSFLGSEPRRLIEEVFATRIFDFYATGELGCIAWECTNHAGYHINTDAFVLELIEGERSVPLGEKGEIVCTALHSHAMPLIRYRTGDVGVFSDEPCPCGRGLPRMSYREGRANTFIITPTNRLVSPCWLVNILKVIPGIAQYKLVQKAKGQLLVKLKKGRDFSSETVNRIRDGLSSALEGINIEVEVVDDMPKDSPGKVWSIVSELPEVIG